MICVGMFSRRLYAPNAGRLDGADSRRRVWSNGMCAPASGEWSRQGNCERCAHPCVHSSFMCTLNVPFVYLCAFAELDETIRLLVNSLHLCFVAAFNMYVCLWVTICVLGGRRAKCQIQNGRTALIGAAEYGHSPCVRLLVESGADINANHVRTHFSFLFMCSLYLGCICVLMRLCALAYFSSAAFFAEFFIAVWRRGVVT